MSKKHTIKTLPLRKNLLLWLFCLEELRMHLQGQQLRLPRGFVASSSDHRDDIAHLISVDLFLLRFVGFLLLLLE